VKGGSTRTPAFGQPGGGSPTIFGIRLRRGVLPSHGWEELRPSIHRPDFTGHLHSGSIRCGNPAPHDEKELFGGSTDVH
jgi:hypothetical protein